MASQGGKLTVSKISGKHTCSFKCKKRAKWSICCSPQFFEIINAYACDEHKRACEECTANNKPVKSELDF